MPTWTRTYRREESHGRSTVVEVTITAVEIPENSVPGWVRLVCKRAHSAYDSYRGKWAQVGEAYWAPIGAGSCWISETPPPAR